MSTHISASVVTKEQLSACSLSVHQDLLAIACRSHIQLHKISPMSGISSEIASFPLKQRGDTSFTVTDVQFNHIDPAYVATSSTNGSIIIFNIEKDGAGRKTELSSEQSTRAVNRVAWSQHEQFILATANQDATVRIYDRRQGSCGTTISPRSDACRDIQFSPHDPNILAAVFESGNLIVWDKRHTDVPFVKVTNAHTSNCLALSWCLAKNWCLATGGKNNCFIFFMLLNSSSILT